MLQHQEACPLPPALMAHLHTPAAAWRERYRLHYKPEAGCSSIVLLQRHDVLFLLPPACACHVLQAEHMSRLGTQVVHPPQEGASVSSVALRGERLLLLWSSQHLQTFELCRGHPGFLLHRVVTAQLSVQHSGVQAPLHVPAVRSHLSELFRAVACLHVVLVLHTLVSRAYRVRLCCLRPTEAVPCAARSSLPWSQQQNPREGFEGLS